MVGVGIGLGHELHLHRPLRELTPGNRVVQVAAVELEIGAGDVGRAPVGQRLDALLRFEEPLQPMSLPGVVHRL